MDTIHFFQGGKVFVFLYLYGIGQRSNTAFLFCGSEEKLDVIHFQDEKVSVFLVYIFMQGINQKSNTASLYCGSKAKLDTIHFQEVELFVIESYTRHLLQNHIQGIGQNGWKIQ